MRLSIIVPMLNEIEQLPDLLAHLRLWEKQGCEVILVDGASTDGSADFAEAIGFTVIRSKRGRARQMNAGARLAGGDGFLFLHADTRLPHGAAQLVVGALTNTGLVWGRFDVEIIGKAALLQIVATLINLRSRLSGIATGDQAIFMSRTAFEALGGFPDQPLMEDIEMSKRLLRTSRPVSLKARVKTSGRRWETRGVFKTIFLMWRLRWAYWRGVPVETLAEAYR